MSRAGRPGGAQHGQAIVALGRRLVAWAPASSCRPACFSLWAFVAGCGGPAAEADKVTLQLNWFHEAEFVGYYVAEAKGFYDAQKLDVTILEGGPGKPARDQVLNGAATFAITSFAEQRDIVTNKQPAVAVMAAFQIPPLVIFSLADSGIREPADLAGKRVGTTTKYWKNVLAGDADRRGGGSDTVTEVDVTPDDLQMLYDRTVDAWLGYAQDEPIQGADGRPCRDQHLPGRLRRRRLRGPPHREQEHRRQEARYGEALCAGQLRGLAIRFGAPGRGGRDS